MPIICDQLTGDKIFAGAQLYILESILCSWRNLCLSFCSDLIILLPIMLNAFKHLLCSKLCWNNRPGPNVHACTRMYVNCCVLVNKLSMYIRGQNPPSFSFPQCSYSLAKVHPQQGVWCYTCHLVFKGSSMVILTLAIFNQHKF